MRNITNLLRYMVVALILVGLAAAVYYTRDKWKPLLDKFQQASDSKPKEAAGHDEHGSEGAMRVKLSEQAQKNLKLVVEPIVPETYTRTLLIPGMVIDRPGLSDRGVISPVAGVISTVYIQPGDTLQPGEKLFNVRLLSEVFQTSQSELFKATKELQLNRENLNRLKGIGEGAISQSRIIELENQDRRLQASITAYRQELLTRGLPQEQINQVSEGKFVSEITIFTPQNTDPGKPLIDAPIVSASSTSQTGLPSFEVKEVKVQVGEQVQAGHALCILANHRLLYIEGRAFKQESGLLEKAAQQGWNVKAEFAEESNGWPASEDNLQIRHLSNTVDPISRTFAFFISITNQSRTFTKDGKSFLVWRFRPGQRVRLKVPVEQFEDVIVLPSEAVVREGAEVFAFRQNGNFFERKPVHLVLEDRDTVLIANDGSLGAGQFVARNGAAALNRALKSNAAGGGGHEGHDHTH